MSSIHGGILRPVRGTRGQINQEVTHAVFLFFSKLPTVQAHDALAEMKSNEVFGVETNAGYLYKFKRHDIAERSMLSDMVRIRYCRRLRYLFT